MENESPKPIGEANKPGLISRSSLYSVVSGHSYEAITTLVDLLGCRNDNVRLGAAKALLDKCLPDIKATEIIEDKPSENLVIITHCDKPHLS